MKRRKRKPVPGINLPAEKVSTDAIPNAEEVGTFLLEPQKDTVRRAVERGRTIGRLEMLLGWIEEPLPPGTYRAIVVGSLDAQTLAPVLRAEVERLRSARP